MILRKAIGLGEGELDDDGRAVLVVGALQWLRSGVALAEWAELDEEERAAVLVARKERDAELATLYGWAAQSPLQAGQVAQVYDGGELLVDTAFGAARDRFFSITELIHARRDPNQSEGGPEPGPGQSGDGGQDCG